VAKINLYVCENYAPDFMRICEERELDEIAVVPFPSMCENKKNKEETSKMLLNSTSGSSGGVVLCGSRCDILSLVPPDRGLEVHTANYCFAHLASEPLINYVLAKGGYIIGPGWLEHWRERISDAGFDRDTAVKFYHEFCRELIFFATKEDPSTEKKLAELSQFLNLPYIIIPVQMDCMRLMIESFVSEYKLHVNQLQNGKKIAQLQAQCAEYGAIFDLINKIAAFSNKRDAIEKVKEIFLMVFGATQFKFWNYGPDNEGLPEEIELLQGREEDFLFLKEENRFCIKIKWKEVLYGAIDVSGFMFPEYIEKYLEFAREIAKICGLVFSNNEQYEKILQAEQDARYSSIHDGLTGLYNRAYINEILQQQGLSKPFSVFMFDIDKLKFINDNYGHAKGDELIINVAAILKSCFRETDIVARLGGDEFMAILQEPYVESAEIIMNRIRQRLAAYNSGKQDSHEKISFSIGYATDEHPDDTLESIIAIADERMYADKQEKPDRR
jgi:diguanylate cyclase (GGDEF)-like protein